MSMAREMRRLERVRQERWRLNAPKREARARARRDERMAAAVEAETIAERRARLLVNLDIAESNPVWAPQAVMLREGLAELPPAGSEIDGMTWAQFKAKGGT